MPRINMQVEDYRIKSDEFQLIVTKIRRDEKGNIRKSKKRNGEGEKDSVSLVGYYGNMRKAMSGIAKDYLTTESYDKKEITTIKEYQEELDFIIEKFHQQIDLEEPFN